MFDERGGRRPHEVGGVPEWAFSGAARLDAAASRVQGEEMGEVARQLAECAGGPRLMALIVSVLERGCDEAANAGGSSEGRLAHAEERDGSDGTDRCPDEVRGADAEAGWTALERLDAASLVELVAAFERVAAWSRAGAARTAVELSRRPETRPQWPAAAGAVGEHCTASTDLSLRLGVTRHAARTLLEVGRTLEGSMRQTGEALEVGHVDWDKARTLVELLGDVPLAVSVEVESAVLPVAHALTRPQLVRAVQRELQRVDHRDAAERHARARTRRHVSRPRVLPDGMAAMTAVLPAEAAVRLDACLHAAAVSARRGGDGRSTDQLRADALDALARGAWDAGWIGTPPGLRGPLGTEDVPADPAGERSDDATTPFAAPRADRSDDATTPFAAPRADRSDDATTPFAAGGESAMRLAQNAGRGTLISVTVGLGTLLGLDDRPGELAGYGPIGADVARMLATEGTWRRLLVDEPSGALLDVDRRRYRPPAGIVDHVRTRNRTCVFPTCSVPAASCQIDHTVPFPHGPTAVDNLGPLCAQHHQLKTHGGFRLHQPQPGSFVVLTPTGHLYLQAPDRQAGVPSRDDVSPDRDHHPAPDDVSPDRDHHPARDGARDEVWEVGTPDDRSLLADGGDGRDPQPADEDEPDTPRPVDSEAAPGEGGSSGPGAGGSSGPGAGGSSGPGAGGSSGPGRPDTHRQAGASGSGMHGGQRAEDPPGAGWRRVWPHAEEPPPF